MPRPRKALTVAPFTIAVDTRDQLPYGFAPEIIRNPMLAYTTERIGLKTGDYSVVGYHIPNPDQPSITIERKSKADAFGSFGANRLRFQAEIVRMAQFTYRAIVIEAEWSEIFTEPARYSKLPPKTILRSAIAWSIRHEVHVWCVPGREFAEQFVYRTLERFVLDVRQGTTIKKGRRV